MQKLRQSILSDNTKKLLDFKKHMKASTLDLVATNGFSFKNLSGVQAIKEFKSIVKNEEIFNQI
jgi:hypothetical protein